MTAVKVACWALGAVLVLAVVGMIAVVWLLRGAPAHTSWYEP